MCAEGSVLSPRAFFYNIDHHDSGGQADGPLKVFAVKIRLRQSYIYHRGRGLLKFLARAFLPLRQVSVR